jgi:hypothetical protein
MRAVAVAPLLFCSLLAMVPACGDDDGDPPVAPDAGSPDAGSPDAMPPDMAPDASPPDMSPDAMPPDASPPAPVLILSTQAVSADEGEPAGATFAVRLSEAPGRTVTVTVASSDGAVAVVDQATLSFTDEDYDLDQVVRVAAVDDADVEDESATITLSADGLPEATVAVTAVDDDTVTIVAAPTALLVAEGGTDTFTVRLGAQPSADVTVSIASSDPGAASVDPATLTFTPGDYDQPQIVTITGVHDADVANEAVSLTLSAPGLTDVTIGVGVSDEDTQRIVVSSDSVTADEDGTASFTVRLSNDPLGTVVVGVAGSDAGAAQATPGELSFDSTSFDQPQTVTVAGVIDDDLADEAVTVTLSATDAAAATVAVNVMDTTQPPYPVDMFVRGSFNGFGLDDELVFEGGVRYTARVALDTGLHELKIADATFANDLTFSASAAGPTLIALGQPTTLEHAVGTFNNTLLDIVQPGEYLFELVVSFPDAPVLTVTLDQPAPFAGAMFVHGSFNDFGLASPMRYEGGTRYTARVVLDQDLHAFKIADALFTATTTFSVDVAGSVEMSLGTPTALEVAPGLGNDTLLAITQPGIYLFDLDAADTGAPVLTITLAEAAPYVVAMFVRGSFNDFSVTDELIYQGAGRYAAQVTLNRSEHLFKIADALFGDTTTFSVDGSVSAPIALDTPTPLVSAPGVGNDTSLDIVQPGIYRFELDAGDPVAPVLTVSMVEAAPFGVNMFVRGSFNDFGVASELIFQGSVTYRAVVELEPGTHAFKIADAIFDAVTTFSMSATGSQEIQLDIDTLLVQAPGFGNDTLLTTVEPGLYQFELAGFFSEQPTLRISFLGPATAATATSLPGGVDASRLAARSRPGQVARR